MDTFTSVTKQNYRWPYPKRIIFRPAQPEITTKPKSFFMYRSVEPHCHCDFHKYEPKMMYYKKLKAQEDNLFDKLSILNRKMAETTTYILNHPCDTDDDKMKSFYETDFKKDGVEYPEYRKLIADIDANAPNPIKLTKTAFLEGYRDPASFRYGDVPRPLLFSCPEVSLKTTPESQKKYFKPTRGRTEYEDNIETTARSIIKNMQQYKEPLPSSRRRFGDPFL